MSGPMGVPALTICEERRRPRDALRWRADVAAAFEADRRLGLEAQPLARAPDRRRVEIRALEHDVARRGADLGVVAAHHAADGARPIAVGDDEHVGLERAVDAIERADALAAARQTNDDRATGEALEVEGVHRLPELEHHVVGDVDDVRDRTDARGRQSIHQPRGRRPDADLEDLRTVARTEQSVLEPDIEPGRARCRWSRSGHRQIR